MLVPTFAFTSFSLLALALAAPAASPQAASSLPVVDLGYQLHRAIAYDGTGDYYNFSNIRYAAPPTGNNRFRPPKAPATDRGAIRTGAVKRVCPQANPSWLAFTGWISEYLQGQNITITQDQVDAHNNSETIANVPHQGQNVYEDCLFLDVMVPKSIFDSANSSSPKRAAVMVWIYGGGYTLGSKTGSGDPAGLLARSMTAGHEGVIYVALNYRLGLFGWLAGPTIQGDGVANAGLYDQRFALEWVQQYIHLFGGDPSRVTVFGESAGGGSIVHQITAYGGQQPVPFSRAIPQSPGYKPQPSPADLEGQLQRVMALTNTTTLKQLRALPSSALIAANSVQVFESNFGQFTYGPAVDGVFVPDLPASLLAMGKFDKNVKVMVGHNYDEGLLFTPFLFNTDQKFTDDLLPFLLPHASQSVLEYIDNTLYPPVYNGSYPYVDVTGREALLISESIFTCHVLWLGNAYKGKDYAYYFTIYPGLHGNDIAYTYYNNNPSSVKNTTAAIALQDWLVTFAQGGIPQTPDVPGAPKFVQWGADGTSHDLGLNAITNVADPTRNERCAWWQKGLYY